MYIKDAWWNDLRELRSRTDKVYEKVGRDIWQVTAEKMIPLRQWRVSEDKLIPILQELGVYYVPKTMVPGPMFVFPEFDVQGIPTRAQTKPLHDLFGDGKYHTLGVKKESFLGPVWLGNSDQTLQRILDTHSLILVEGPFDLIAAKIAAPHQPIMSPLTKSLGEKHEDWLKIMGVKQLYLMFDNEVSGAGEKSAEWLSQFFSIPAMSLRCPGADPSDCLKVPAHRKALIKVLGDME